jgi:hypothetical protein
MISDNTILEENNIPKPKEKPMSLNFPRLIITLLLNEVSRENLEIEL